MKKIRKAIKKADLTAFDLAVELHDIIVKEYGTHNLSTFITIFKGGLDVEKEEETYSIGDRFVGGLCDRNEYILCTFDGINSGLINLKYGDRWRDPIVAENLKQITQSEFIQIAGKGTFKKI